MASSDEELELARARAKAKLRLKQQGQKRRNTRAEMQEKERPDVSRGKSFLEGSKQGLTFGFADEMQAKFGNWLDDITGLNDDVEAMGLGRVSKEEAYKSLRDEYRQDVKDAQEANPGAYFAGEVAGSLLIPGGSGAAATKAATAAAKRASGAKGLVKATKNAARQLSPQGTGRALGRAAGEGAAYGAGTAEEMDDVGRAAVFGGLSGAAFTGALRGVGAAGKQVAKRRIKKDLLDEATGEFTPASIADAEGRLGDFYRNFIGRSFGGRQRIKMQEKPIVERMAGKLDNAQQAQKDLAKAIKERPKVNPDVVARERKAFFNQAEKAIPDNARATKAGERMLDRAFYQTGKPETLMKAMKQYWRKEAFKQVKGMDFEVDDDLIAILRREFPDDDIAETMRGKVSGKDLLNLRNRYAMKANKGANATSGDVKMSAGQARQYAETIGGWMKQKMGKDEARLFNDELAAWGDWKALSKAVKKSDEGRFDINALRKADMSDKRLTREGYGQQIGDKAKADIDRIIEKQRVGDYRATEAARKAVNTVKQEARDLNDLLVAKNPSGLSEALSTRMQAPMADKYLGPLGQLAAGALIGTGMATQRGQRLLAGQTRGQNFMRKLGDDERARLIAEIIRRGGTMESALGATEEEY